MPESIHYMGYVVCGKAKPRADGSWAGGYTIAADGGRKLIRTTNVVAVRETQEAAYSAGIFYGLLHVDESLQMHVA